MAISNYFILHLHVSLLGCSRVHRVMLVLYFDINVSNFIDYIEPFIGYFPTISGLSEYILMKISNMIVVRLIHLP